MSRTSCARLLYIYSDEMGLPCFLNRDEEPVYSRPILGVLVTNCTLMKISESALCFGVRENVIEVNPTNPGYQKLWFRTVWVMRVRQMAVSRVPVSVCDVV